MLHIYLILCEINARYLIIENFSELNDFKVDVYEGFNQISSFLKNTYLVHEYVNKALILFYTHMLNYAYDQKISIENYKKVLFEIYELENQFEDIKVKEILEQF